MTMMTKSKFNINKARQVMEKIVDHLVKAGRRKAKKLNCRKRKILVHIMKDWNSRRYLPGGKRAD